MTMISRSKSLSILVLGLIFLFCGHLYCQDLEQIGKERGIGVSGSFNANAITYFASEIKQRRDPFNWFLTGNLNFNIFGYEAPFSFSCSNTGKNFSQPFNQFSFSPRYKWVKTYIGYNSMSFSPYTLSNHVFLGGGVELSPGKWRFAAMTGRLKKAVPLVSNDSMMNYNASFKRMGYGFKAGYENDGDLFSINVFNARDVPQSIPYKLPESDLTPHENIAMGISGRKRLGRFFVDVEYAVSALNTNTGSNLEHDTTAIQSASGNLLIKLLPENTTTRYFDAINAGLGYQSGWSAIQIRYERIAPEYQTLGAYYFNSDQENFTVAPTLRLFNSRLTLSGNIGLQRNNLDDARSATTKRFVSAVNASYQPNEYWSASTTLSTFTAYTNIRPQPDPYYQDNLDTLNFYQINRTATGMLMRSFGASGNPQSLMVNASYQQAGEEADYEDGDSGSEFMNASIAYSWSSVARGAMLAVSVNMCANTVAGIRSSYWGPTVMYAKSFFNNALRSSLSAAYNETKGVNSSGPVLNNRLYLTWSSKESKGTLSLSLNYLTRFGDFSAFTGTVNYGYSF